MSDTVLRIVGLGKKYQIGGEQQRYRTLRDTIVQTAMRPIERIRHPGAATYASEVLWALKNVDLEVQRGEVIGIIGRNGAGKSTLLKVLSRITGPTEGRVEICGRVGSLLEVGTGFHSELTGRENIQLNGAILGMSRAEIRSKFDEIVEFSEIGRFLDTPVKRYSSGMYVRLAFAVAAHLEPEVLIIDEVLSVGDSEFQKRCLGKIAEIGHSGRTVLFVSHNMAAVQSLCTRAVLLESGILAADGPTREIVHRYLGGADVNSAERTWQSHEAPHADGVTILAMRVADQSGTPLALVNASDDANVEIDYAVGEGVRVGATLLVSDEEGTLVFGSLDNRQAKWHHKARQAGVYRSTCTIPGHLLNIGGYSVGVIMWRDNYRLALREDDVVRFQVTEDGVDRGDYMGGHEGVVRPLLEWDTVRVGDEC